MSSILKIKMYLNFILQELIFQLHLFDLSYPLVLEMWYTHMQPNPKATGIHSVNQ